MQSSVPSPGKVSVNLRFRCWIHSIPAETAKRFCRLEGIAASGVLKCGLRGISGANRSEGDMGLTQIVIHKRLQALAEAERGGLWNSRP